MGGNCLKYLKRGWKKKRWGDKDFKKGGKLGQEVGALKKGVELEPSFVIHALNILLECIERNTFFKIGEQ